MNHFGKGTWKIVTIEQLDKKFKIPPNLKYSNLRNMCIIILIVYLLSIFKFICCTFISIYNFPHSLLTKHYSFFHFILLIYNVICYFLPTYYCYLLFQLYDKQQLLFAIYLFTGYYFINLPCHLLLLFFNILLLSNKRWTIIYFFFYQRIIIYFSSFNNYCLLSVIYCLLFLFTAYCFSITDIIYCY